PRDEGRKLVVRLLDEHSDAGRRQILSAELLGEGVELVQAHRRLTRGRAARHELPHVLLDIVERRAVLATRPDVWEPLRELTDGALDAGGIAAGDNQRALLAERPLHDL